MVQKAVEMGAARLEPVFTRRSVAERVNLKRMRANAIEAAEQCGALTVPEIAEPVPFSSFVAEFDESRLLVFCDEEADMQDPIAALAAARPLGGEPVAITVLVGPEGGFADSERSALLRLPKVVRLSLGPRILRADTAAVAALAFVGAVLGDWR
jgi:16S rRNA (uracil1498-N3)-methyltransferase